VTLGFLLSFSWWQIFQKWFWVSFWGVQFNKHGDHADKCPSWRIISPRFSSSGLWDGRMEGNFFKTVVFKKLLLRFCEFGHYAFASFGFTELKSQKHYPWCCTRQTLAIQQKRGSSTIAGPCHSWRSSSDRYRVALFPPLVSPVDIAWLLYFSNTVIRTVVITVIFFLKGWFTAFIFWSYGVWLSPTFWFSECYGISILCISAWGEKHFLVAIFCQNIIWGMLLLFFLMGWPNGSHYNLLLCYNWLGCSFLADKPILSSSKTS